MLAPGLRVHWRCPSRRKTGQPGQVRGVRCPEANSDSGVGDGTGKPVWIGAKGMMLAAKALALTALDLETRPDLLKAAREEFEKSTGGKAYISPLPEGAVPRPAS